MSIKRILISQPQPENGKSPYFEVAEKHGVNAVFRSFIRVESLTTREVRDQKIRIEEYTSIVFTTRKAMEHFFQLAEDLKVKVSDSMKYFCLNEQLANYLQKFIVYRKRKVFYPQDGTQASMVALIHKHNKERHFLPLPEGHKNDLIDAIRAKKVELYTGVMFRTVPVEFTEEERAEKFDLFIFFTPVGIASLKANYPDIDKSTCKFAVSGAQTLKALEDLGLEATIIAPSPEYPSMIIALDKYLAKANK